MGHGYAPFGFAVRLPLQNRRNMHCNTYTEMVGLNTGRFAVLGRRICLEIDTFLSQKRHEIPHKFCVAAICLISDSADYPFPLSRRQIVTSRAVVEMSERHHTLWNQMFSGRPHARRLFCSDIWRQPVFIPQVNLVADLNDIVLRQC